MVDNSLRQLSKDRITLQNKNFQDKNQLIFKFYTIKIYLNCISYLSKTHHLEISLVNTEFNINHNFINNIIL